MMSHQENLEAFNDLLPLLNLAEAINYLRLEIYEKNENTTLADLINPTKSMVEIVFCLFNNFILFVQERRAGIAEKEEDVEDKAQQMNNMIMEKDKYKIEIDDLQLEIMKSEQEIKKVY